MLSLMFSNRLTKFGSRWNCIVSYYNYSRWCSMSYNDAPCFCSLVMWFIGECFGTTQGKKMALVKTCMTDAQDMQIQILFAYYGMGAHVCICSFQICGKHCHKTLKRSPSYLSRGQSHLMNWNMIDVKEYS
jgi:hypothetical protein